MMRQLPAYVLTLLSLPALAWEFAEPVTVSSARANVFHHLEAAGRASLAVSGTDVAVTWEDNRSGRPEVYVALKRAEQNFGEALRVSRGGTAYEPAIAALADDGFVIAWEEEGRVHARAMRDGSLGPVVPVEDAPGTQATLAAAPDGGAVIAWVRGNGAGAVVSAEAALREGGLELSMPAPVEPGLEAPEQLYPSVAVTDSATIVAWEDRRHGHTRLLYAVAPSEGGFGAPQELNERPPSRSEQFGRGTGVTRVALTAGANGEVAAVWMDKREFEGGYKVYAAAHAEARGEFGENAKVQDVFGDTLPQWHPSIALGPDGTAVAAWDDRRDDTSDVWLSWRTENGWSDDVPVDPAYGPGEQSHPVLAFDERGVLHLAWVTRGAEGGTEIRYATARR